jgi:peptidoglycan/LPS O-acetylase OafA/YrhL
MSAEPRIEFRERRAPAHREIDYRPDIDALRAIAVLAVIGFHAFPERLPGGYVGVDVFFVISGFLISGIILRGLGEGRFRFTDFYARRIKRIFPALLTVLCASLLIGWFVVFPDEWRSLGKHAAGGAGFVYNLIVLRDAGYFNPASAETPLLHLWSLGVEEQFYIVWPLVLVLLRRHRRVLPVTLGGLALGSFALNVALLQTDPSLVFYSPFTRMWELAIGSLLAYFMLTSTPPHAVKIGTGRRALVLEIVAWSGLAAIGMALMMVDEAKPFPGWWALLPTVGTAMLIAAGPRTWLARKVLAQPALVFIGLISYPIYLWHWPLLSFAHIARSGVPSRNTRLALIAATLVLAWLTYVLIEKPIRFRGQTRQRAKVLLALMLVVGLLGIQIGVGNVPSHFPRDRTDYIDSFENTPPSYRYFSANYLDVYRDQCNFYDFMHNRSRDRIARECYEPHSSKSLLLWGDSHAQQFFHGLAETLPRDVSILQVATSGCSPSLDEIARPGWTHCNRSNVFALQVARKVRPQLVVLAQSGLHERTDWARLAATLEAAGVAHVVLLGPVPHWTPDLHKVIASRYWESTPKRLATNLEPKSLATDRQLKSRYSAHGKVIFISLMDRLCTVQGCLAYLGRDRKDGIFAWDTEHLTPTASEYVARKILAPAFLDLFDSAQPEARL